MPVTKVRVNGKAELWGWDTGASHNMVFSRKNAGVLTASGSGKVRLMIGHNESDIPIQLFEVPETPLQGLFGYDFFMSNKVCFDFERGLASIEPFTD